MSEVEPSAEALKEGIAVGPPGVPVVSNEPLGDKVQETRKKEETVDKAPANPETLENETVAGVPAEAQPLAQAVITPAKLSEMVLVNVVAGRLKVLPRLITLLAHLDPWQRIDDQRGSVVKQEEDGFLYVPNLFSPAIVQDVFSKIAPQASLAFPNLLRVLESQNWSKLVSNSGPKLTIAFNEYFEDGYLNFLKMEQYAETLLQGEVSKEHFKTRSEISRELDQQLQCLSRAKKYSGRYPELNEHIFSEENLQTIIELIQREIQYKTPGSKTTESCLMLIIRWCFSPKPSPYGDEFKRFHVLNFVDVIRLLLEQPNLSEQIFPLSILLLEYQTDQECRETYELIKLYMVTQSQLFLCTKYLSQVLTGIGLVLVASNDDDLVGLTDLLLGLWKNGSSNQGLISLSHGRQLFQMFTRVFHIRTKNTNARPKKWREATIKARNDVNTSANEEAGDTKPAEPEKIPERIRIDQEPRQLLEEDWLLPLALVCRENYYFSQHYASKTMSLFATAGLLKGMSDVNLFSSSASEEILNNILTDAVMNHQQINDPNYHELWIQSLSIIMVNIDKAFPQIQDKNIISLVSHTFLANIFNLSYLIVAYLDSTKAQNKRTGGQEVLQMIKDHRESELYREVNLFTDTISNLWLTVNITEERTHLLKQFEEHAIQLHRAWRSYRVDYQGALHDTNSFAPMDEPFEVAILHCFRDFYLSLLVILKITLPDVTAYQALIWLSIFSHLEFCSVKIQGKDVSFMTTAIGSLLEVISENYLNYVSRLVSSIEPFADPGNVTVEKFVEDPEFASDSLFQSRVSFLLGLFEVIMDRHVNNIRHVNEHDLEDIISPICFVFIEHPNPKLNARAHNVFQNIILISSPFRERIIPYYIKQTLKNYPKKTQIESIAKSMSLVVSKLPPTSPLVPLTFDYLKAKVEETMGLSYSFPPPTQSQPSQPQPQLQPQPQPQLQSQLQLQADPQLQHPQQPRQQEGDLAAQYQDAARSKYEPYMVIVLFELLSHVHRHMLHYLLGIIEEIVTKSDKKMQVILCHLLFKIISKNYDYTRKEVCIKWYLKLCNKLGINKLSRL